MPDFPIVDTHVHLWDPRRFRMSWLDGNDLLNRPWSLEDYVRAIQGTQLNAAVYLQVEVEPPYAYLEAKWAAEIAQHDARLAAIVPWAPLEYGDRARAFVEALLEIGPIVKGVRRIIQFESDSDFCLRPDFARGVRMLSEYGLSFDVCLKGAAQMDNAIELVRACPDTSFILDHIGKPNIATHEMEPWRAHIEALGALPNVVCKVSGLATEAAPSSWTEADLRPYVEHVISVFGEDRLLFGGDWPVALQATTYPRWVAALDAFTVSLSPAARRKLWVDNARRVYRLG